MRAVTLQLPLPGIPDTLKNQSKPATHNLSHWEACKRIIFIAANAAKVLRSSPTTSIAVTVTSSAAIIAESSPITNEMCMVVTGKSQA